MSMQPAFPLSPTALAEALAALQAEIRTSTLHDAWRAVRVAQAGLTTLEALLRHTVPGQAAEATTPPPAPVAAPEPTAEVEAPPAPAEEAPAEDPPPAADSTAGQTTRGFVWSAERLALLREEYPSAKDMRALLERLNALPGRQPISSIEAVHSQAHLHRIRRVVRPQGVVGAAAMSAVASPWTPEREAKLRELWAQAATDEVILAALQALEGPPFVRWRQVQDKATILKLGRRPVSPGAKADKWTAERRELLRELWPQLEISPAALAERLSALPGPPVTPSQATSYAVAVLRLGARGTLRAAEHAAQHEPAPTETPQPDEAALPPRHARDKLTAARAALLQELWPQGEIPVTTTLARINALPGEPYTSTASLYGIAQRLGLPSERPAAKTVTAIAPEVADAAIEARHERAKALLREGKPEHIVQMQTRLPLREVFRLKMEVREERRRAEA